MDVDNNTNNNLPLQMSLFELVNLDANAVEDLLQMERVGLQQAQQKGEDEAAWQEAIFQLEALQRVSNYLLSTREAEEKSIEKTRAKLEAKYADPIKGADLLERDRNRREGYKYIRAKTLFEKWPRETYAEQLKRLEELKTKKDNPQTIFSAIEVEVANEMLPELVHLPPKNAVFSIADLLRLSVEALEERAAHSQLLEEFCLPSDKALYHQQSVLWTHRLGAQRMSPAEQYQRLNELMNTCAQLADIPFESTIEFTELWSRRVVREWEAMSIDQRKEDMQKILANRSKPKNNVSSLERLQMQVKDGVITDIVRDFTQEEYEQHGNVVDKLILRRAYETAPGVEISEADFPVAPDLRDAAGKLIPKAPAKLEPNFWQQLKDSLESADSLTRAGFRSSQTYQPALKSKGGKKRYKVPKLSDREVKYRQNLLWTDPQHHAAQLVNHVLKAGIERSIDKSKPSMEASLQAHFQASHGLNFSIPGASNKSASRTLVLTAPQKTHLEDIAAKFPNARCRDLFARAAIHSIEETTNSAVGKRISAVIHTERRRSLRGEPNAQAAGARTFSRGN